MRSFEINKIPFLQFSIFPNTKLFHFVTTVNGGVGQGEYATFNLGEYCGDDADTVTENRRLLAQTLGIAPADILVPYQTHGDKICIIEKNILSMSECERKEQLKGVDALITCEKGVCIGITTADCVPIFLFDPTKGIFAAIHAGWKSTCQSIAIKTVSLMIDRFGTDTADLLAGIGPAISVDKFEVGDEVGKAFEDEGYSLSSFSYRNTKTTKLHIDLKEANRLQLLSIGILSENIEVSELCTHSNPEQFFSARRQGYHSGRMLTGGMLI
jgi:YfiH family protein